MRRAIFRMDEGEARSLLARAPHVHLASTGDDGRPILRVLHGVVDEFGIAFHGAAAGEKHEAVGRAAVVSAEEVVALLPSYFVDPERACPATTYYRSVQAHGRIERVDEPAVKARVLAALMQKLQPEGGHVPIDADHPLYRNAVRGISILRVRFERIDGKAKLGQNRKPEELAAILERLWRRGAPGDPEAVERVLAANPTTPLPGFLRAPGGARLSCALGPADLASALALLAGSYWNRGVPAEALARAHLGASAWVGARDGAGTLVATARALSDGGKIAWIYDVVVAAAWRGRGLGEALVRLLLDHPRVRGAGRILLGTVDAQPFYRRLGFVERASSGATPGSTLMALEPPAG
jgi:nitroimidazol reductase NimA-like FMN-containing flavoprotein (pyridoxamine 5'-phosphate oxidase superfamily)/GNAT superfamily N-acetyltransferase